jgi:hypothetical protein
MGCKSSKCAHNPQCHAASEETERRWLGKEERSSSQRSFFVIFLARKQDC